MLKTCVKPVNSLFTKSANLFIVGTSPAFVPFLSAGSYTTNSQRVASFTHAISALLTDGLSSFSTLYTGLTTTTTFYIKSINNQIGG